jgi:hypothetical protein
MKKLPNTIKITRAVAGEPRSYSEDQFQQIIEKVGPLPAGKVLYQGDYAAFSIFGEEIPELVGMFHHYMQNGHLNKKKMTRRLALRCHLEGAAWKYKQDRKNEDLTPSQKLRYYKTLEKASNTLIKRMGFLDSQARLHFSTMVGSRGESIRQEADRIIFSLQKEILKQKELCSKKIIPRGKRHQRDVVLHSLINALCDAWVYIMGRKTSTGSVSSDGKKVGGPLIRFLQSAIRPLGIDKKPNAIREILRDLKVKSNG